MNIIIFIVYFVIILISLFSSIHQLNLTNKRCIGYDFDDCLRNYKTKEDIMPVVNSMINDYNNGNKVVIITARGDLGVKEIEIFLQKYGLEDKIPIYPTGSKRDRRKSTVINKLGVQEFYDDNDNFLNDILKNSDHPVILHKIYPYNKNPIRNYP